MIFLLNQKLNIFFLVGFLIIANGPSALCKNSEPIIFVSGDGSGDFYCDGKDDHVQINEALQLVAENSSYTTVYLKGPFTYVINDTLLIGSNTILEGDSTAKIKLVCNAGWAAWKPMIKENSSGSHDITVRGFTIDGNREGNTNVVSGKGYYNLIHLSNCQNISVYDMYLTNNHGDGLKTNNCSNIKLYNNKIYLLGHDGLYAIHSSNLEAWNNTVTCRANSGLRIYNTNHVSLHDNTITSEGSGGAGIEIEKFNTSLMDDIEIYNNIINKTLLAGIHLFGYGNYSANSTNIHIHHNQIYDTRSVSANAIGGIVSSGFTALIENNVFDGCYGSAISQKETYLPILGSGYVITLRNNIIINSRPSLDRSNGYGVYNLLTDTHSFVLQNNCFYNNTGGNYKGVNASSSDINADPLFVDEGKHNYHLKSKEGHWNGNGWINDNISSPCIDTGYPFSSYSNEPEYNGGRINIGAYGNTKYASKSESNTSTTMAVFSGFPTSGKVPLNVSFTDRSTGSPTSWKWYFGDGTNSTQRNPVHTYSKAGKYTVTLAVGNTVGSNTAAKYDYIDVTNDLIAPVAAFSGSPTSGKEPLNVSFTDRSTGSPTSWKWYFGDGTNSTQRNPVHTYSKAGKYAVTLAVGNTVGSNTASKYGYINVASDSIAPVAVFSGFPTSGKGPLSVSFTDSSTGSPTSWKWYFGDGANSTQKNPVHTYSKAGKYAVTLAVNNIEGSNTVAKYGYINVTLSV